MKNDEKGVMGPKSPPPRFFKVKSKFHPRTASRTLFKNTIKINQNENIFSGRECC